MKHPSKLRRIERLLGFAALAASAFGQAPPVPPSFPVPSTNLVFRPIPVAEWELTFEHSPDLAFTNTSIYPIAITVPFEDETGFIRIVAHKVQPERAVGLPTEFLLVPNATNGQMVIWDYFADSRVTNRYSGDSYEFAVPAWDRWYLLTTDGWDKWIGHFKTE